jgi:dipeptidyl aminopeptidase/acylaminoacyl peptidase
VTRLALALALAVLVAGCADGEEGSTPAGTWRGTFRLPVAAEPVPVSLALAGGRAVVSLAPGHAARTVVPVEGDEESLRFSLPGRSGPVEFELRLRNGRLAGDVRQGALRGTAGLGRGSAIEGGVHGLYRFADGRLLAVVRDYGPSAGVLFPAGEVRQLSALRQGEYAIGSGRASRAPSAGRVTFGAADAVWRGERAERVPLRQEEVRVPAGRHGLACTLTIPPGEGRRAAVAFAHGAGPADRSRLSTLAAFYAGRGLVTLACDKRGIGQSGGVYQGEGASDTSIDAHARDVAALARWLGRQPEVDPERVGISGRSQAGWIIPLAAAREPSVRWAVLVAGPTYTTGGDAVWGGLAGQGDYVPTQPDAEIEQAVREARDGFDPLPSIRALRVPALWLFGGRDRHVSTRVSVELLEPLAAQPGRDLSFAVFPRANHLLIETETPFSLHAEADRSSRYGEGLWRTVGAWLAARGLSAGR